MKHLYALLVLALLLAACAPAAQAATETPQPPTAIPSATSEPTPSAPESIIRQQNALAGAGYSVEVLDGEVRLVHSGEPVLISTEAATLSITIGGERLTFPEDALEFRGTIGARVEQILTITGPEGQVDYFYLPRTREWASPIELQTNPRGLENYPEIALEDLWSGRVLHSELLEAQPFPSSAIRPDSFVYVIYRAGGSVEYDVLLHEVIRGELDISLSNIYSMKQHTEYRRWSHFYRSSTPESVPVIIATQQRLTPNGRLLFFHYVFGPDWSFDEPIRLGNGYLFNLLHSVFLSFTDEPPEGYLAYNIKPHIHAERRPTYDERDWSQNPGRENMGAREVRNLVLLEENNPLSIREDLEALIRDGWEALSSPYEIIGQAGIEELHNLEYLAISVARNLPIPPDSEYYGSTP